MAKEPVKNNNSDFDPIGSCKIWKQQQNIRYFGKPPIGFNTKYIQNKIRIPARTNQVQGSIIDSFVVILN